MLENNFQKALLLICDKLGKNVNWALIGSCNLALQGIEGVKPKDLDILCFFEESDNVKKLLSNYNPSQTTPLSSDFEEIKIQIDDTEVQLCLGHESGTYRQLLKQGELIYFQLSGRSIPCFKITDELKAYTHLGKTEKAKLIKDFLLIQ